VRHNALEQRDGSLNLLRCEETDDADLGQSAIVELLHQTGGLGLLGLVLVEAEGIVKTSDGNGVGDQLLVLVEAGELAGLATAHVVGTSGLREPLEEANKEDDLPLGSVGEGIPLLRGAAGGSGDTATDGGPGEGDAVGLDDVANEGGHGNTAVLDLGVAEEANGGLIALSPDGGAGEVEGVVVLEYWVGLFGEGLKVGLFSMM